MGYMGSGVAWLCGLHRFESCVGTWVTRVRELRGCVGYMGSGVLGGLLGLCR